MNLTVPSFERASVLVIGDVMLDRYLHGETSRISPEAPVPVLRLQRQDDRPGGAANVALNLAALGARARLVGLVGQDEAARSLRDLLDRSGIEAVLLEMADAPTIVKTRVMGRGQQLIRIDMEAPFAPSASERVAATAVPLLPRADVVVLSDYGKGSLAAVRTLIDAARECGRPVVVDPKGSDPERYRGATLLAPNMSEFETFVGECVDEDSVVRKGTEFVARLGLDALLVTRGADGMTLIERGGEASRFPAHAREVFDVTGAGDTVVATLAAALASGQKLPEAAALANFAAGVVVAKVGTSSVTAYEIGRAIATVFPADTGQVARDELARQVAAASAAGEKIVFTNGCFDILHAGHVLYLEQARQLGDRLVVALNDDASVSRLKGEGRPINGLDRRMAVISALRSVDWCVSFHEDTPIPLIQALRPDVLVKGGDYGLDGVVGAEQVRAYGGEVKVLSLVENSSTTAILEKIRSTDETVSPARPGRPERSRADAVD